MKEYKKGDKVWWAHCETQEVRLDCPVCFGKKQVTLILGNDEQIATECDYCGKGFEGPTGYVTEYEWIAAQELVTLDGVSINEHGDTREIRYSWCNYVLYPEDVFDTEEEARLQCEKKSAEHAAQEKANKYVRSQSSHKSYSWHVGYSRREIKRLQDQINWHSARVIELTPKIRESKVKKKEINKDNIPF